MIIYLAYDSISKTCVALQAFATPETLIGLHPDAGASFYLSHLPGYLGNIVPLTNFSI